MGRFFLSGDFYLLEKSPHQCSQFAVYDRIFLAIDNMDVNHAFFLLFMILHIPMLFFAVYDRTYDHARFLLF